MFSYKFCFPKVGKEFPKRIKDFTDNNSFPILSINVTLNKTIPDFVYFSTASAEKEISLGPGIASLLQEVPFQVC